MKVLEKRGIRFYYRGGDVELAYQDIYKTFRKIVISALVRIRGRDWKPGYMAEYAIRTGLVDDIVNESWEIFFTEDVSVFTAVLRALQRIVGEHAKDVENIDALNAESDDEMIEFEDNTYNPEILALIELFTTVEGIRQKKIRRRWSPREYHRRQSGAL